MQSDDAALIQEALRLLRTSNFPRSCSIRFLDDHDAGRLLSISALNVDLDRVGTTFSLNRILLPLGQRIPVLGSALTSTASANSEHHPPLYVPEHVPPAQSASAIARPIAIERLAAFSSKSSRHDWRRVFARIGPPHAPAHSIRWRDTAPQSLLAHIWLSATYGSVSSVTFCPPSWEQEATSLVVPYITIDQLRSLEYHHQGTLPPLALGTATHYSLAA